MRALLALLAVAVCGSAAFALSELHSLHHVAPGVAPLEETAVAQIPTEPAPTARVQAARPELSTWRGPLPFGGVPVQAAQAANLDDVDTDDVADESDRCPETLAGNLNDDDVCPVLTVERVPSRIEVDGPHQIVVDGRVITIEMESIIF